MKWFKEIWIKTCLGIIPQNNIKIYIWNYLDAGKMSVNTVLHE